MLNKRRRLTIKKAIIAILLSTTLCHTYNKIKLINTPPNINSEYNGENYFASYSNGKIYICTTKNQDRVCSKIDPNDIVVVDKRKEDDPDMKILHSYSIYDVFTMHEILNVILAYEQKDPSEWSRTYESMRNEWIMHNLSYMFNYERDRTRDADLDNADEELYKNLSPPKINKIS